jgi:hypothetical protein
MVESRINRVVLIAQTSPRLANVVSTPIRKKLQGAFTGKLASNSNIHVE